MSQYVPEMKAEILALVVQRVVDMDALIQEDIEDLEEEAEEKLLRRSDPRDGDMDEEDSGESDDSMSDSECTTTEEAERLQSLRAKVAKMDGTLDFLFEYYSPLIEDGSTPQHNVAFQQLISHFTTFILPRRSRHTQFLIFHFAQISRQHTAFFAERCLQIAMNQAGMPLLRLTACAYLASFVARGAQIPSDTLHGIVEHMCDYLNIMKANYERTCRGPDRRSYPLYYAIAQALLYIFCFRWRDLIISGDDDGEDDEDILFDGRDLRWAPNIKEVFTNNIYSKLNPLKICSPAIVTQFARIAHHLRFMYVFPLLETNKRLRLSRSLTSASSSYGTSAERETALSGKTGESAFQLDAYFPFDPYHLPKSKRWMEGDYVEWKSIPGLDDVEQGEESDSDSDEDMEDEQEFEEKTETEGEDE